MDHLMVEKKVYDVLVAAENWFSHQTLHLHGQSHDLVDTRLELVSVLMELVKELSNARD